MSHTGCIMWGFSYTSPAGFLMWGVSLACSLEAGGCFMLRFSLIHLMDVLTIPIAYPKTTTTTKPLCLKNKLINKKVLNSRTHLMLASF